MNRTPTSTRTPRQRPASRACCMGVRLRCRSRQNLKRSFHRNQQYSVTAITDGSGSIVERYAYSAYGTPTITDASGTLRTTTASGNRYAYTGREYDETLALYHYRARMYDSVGGRFVSRDPVGFVGGTYCLFEYVKGRPYFYVDPEGKFGHVIVKYVCQKVVVPVGKYCAKKVWDGCKWIVTQVKGPPKTTPPGPPHTWPIQKGVHNPTRPPGIGPRPTGPKVNTNPKPGPDKTPKNVEDWIDRNKPKFLE